MKNVLRGLIIVLLSTVFIVSPSSSFAQYSVFGQTNTTPTPTNPFDNNTKVVTIKDMQYSPVSLTVAPGTKVAWINKDDEAHTVTSDNTAGNEIWDSGNIEVGKSYARTFNTPGSYNYHCTIHPNMKGIIVVQSPITMQPSPTVPQTIQPTPVPQQPVAPQPQPQQQQQQPNVGQNYQGPMYPQQNTQTYPMYTYNYPYYYVYYPYTYYYPTYSYPTTSYTYPYYYVYYYPVAYTYPYSGYGYGQSTTRT